MILELIYVGWDETIPVGGIYMHIGSAGDVLRFMHMFKYVCMCFGTRLD